MDISIETNSMETQSITMQSTEMLSSLTQPSEIPDESKTSQIFDMKHLQDVLDKAHVCDGGRLQLIPNALPSIGLFHQNVLRCTKCFNETPLTNFQVMQSMKAEQQEPNKRL
ncbi:unnamed protein product [Rotaria sp. Silwood1]|nr:unnamed protein product [Rotaria sp. Silwood1]CAF1665258.1 unnamed protein product [Rotaria sp. Silwood1]CAF3914033.1 unnamed protein product [Rotaria sp. Silwood1]CAF3928280.1 unnamed protein product [Rotaria sp. Silwood1]CAF3980483.1 unnamed protein product [Rotaria sp. Silwood1]